MVRLGRGRDPRVHETQRATALVDRAFGSPALAASDDFDKAADADELVAAVLGGLRRDGIATASVLGGLGLAGALLERDDLTAAQRSAVVGLVTVLRQW